MTSVRQGKGAAKSAKGAGRATKEAATAKVIVAPKAPRKKAVPRKVAAPKTQVSGGSSPTGSQLAQVRLQPDEVADLHSAMVQLKLPTRSDALREAIRLLIREAAEVTAAEDIRNFYAGGMAPLPDGVVPASAEELARADAEPW